MATNFIVGDHPELCLAHFDDIVTDIGKLPSVACPDKHAEILSARDGRIVSLGHIGSGSELPDSLEIGIRHLDGLAIDGLAPYFHIHAKRFLRER